MRLSFKTKIILMILSILTVFFASIIWAWHVYVKPEYIRTKVENILASSLNMPVSIETMRARIFPSFVLSAAKLKIGTQDTVLFGAGKAVVRISLWRLLIGQVRIAGVYLDKPYVKVHSWDALKSLKIRLPRRKKRLPRINVAHGEIDGFISGRYIKIKDINGYISRRGISLSGGIAGGNVSLNGFVERPRWRYSLSIDSLALGDLFNKLRGKANINLEGEVKDDAVDMSASAEVSSLELLYPSRHVELGDVTLGVGFKGDKNELSIDRILFDSSIITLRGHGEVKGLKEFHTAALELDMQSDDFDYDNFVGCLPIEYFPTWLSKVLVSKIRHGKSRFSHIHYRGPLDALKDPHRLLAGLYIKEILDGQWFNEGYTNDTVKGITGSFVLKDGNAIFENLSGYMGKSRIDRVDVRFLDIARHGLRLEVETHLNKMALKAFLPAWRAIVMPAKLNRLFAGVTHVRGGRVSGNVRVRWDKLSGKPAQVCGNVYLDNCTFNWGDIRLRELTCRAVSKGFDSPVLVDLKGVVNSLPVDSLKMSMVDLFGKKTYTYTLRMYGMGVGNVFQAKDHLRLVIKGTGRGPAISGSIQLSSKGFSLFGTHYRYAHGFLHGRGKLKGRLFNGFELDIRDLYVPVARQKLALSISITGAGGRLKVKGPLALNCMDALAEGRYHRLKGLVDGDVLVIWKKKTKPYLKGKVRFRDALIYQGDRPVELTGYVIMKGKRIKSTMLNLMVDGVTYRVSGYLDLMKRPYFKGDIDIDNLRVNNGKTSTTRGLFDSLDGDANLDVSNIIVLGIPFKEGEARARLIHGRLKLSGIRLNGLEGNVKGSVSLCSFRPKELDLYLGLKGVDMKDFFASITGGTGRMEGKMDLIGHIWGKTDSLNGNLAFYASDGRILRFSLLSKLFSILNVYKILKTRTLDIFEHGFPYNYISSTFTIKDGVMFFDDFRLDSNSLQFSAIGRYVIKKKYIDASLGVQPLETFDKAISIIPIIGWVITGKNKRIFVVSFKVTGDIEDPSIMVEPMDTLSDAIKGPLLRGLRLPKEIIKNPRGLIMNNP